MQEQTTDPFMLLGLDTCFAMVPARWAGGPDGPMRHLGFSYRKLPSDDGRPMLEIAYGEVGWRMMAGFHRGVVEMIRAGNRVIIDEMLLDGRVRDDWLQLLAPWRPLRVGLFCADEELARREADRGNRPGLARWSARRAHLGMEYDLTLDSTASSPAANAAKIVTALVEADGRSAG